MTKAKETKLPQRHSELDRIATRLRTMLRHDTTGVIEKGKLLLRSRELLADEHGQWMPWLAENFDLSYRTAIRYVSAAEYVAGKGKSDIVADFANLSPTVLYWLAADNYSEQEEAAILAATRKKRVDEDAADAICEALAPLDDADDADDADDQDDDGDDGAEPVAAEDPETTEIIERGRDPAVPPTAPIPPPTDYALRDFDQAVGALKRLMTKPGAQFAASVHSANDLQEVENFLHAVAHAVTKAKAVPEVAS
jgi:hypothetical protein